MKKNMMGLGVVAVLAVGIWLGGFFKGLGWGPGDGSGRSGDQSGSVAHPAGGESRVDNQIGGSQPAVRPANPPVNENRGPLNVVITGNGYRLATSEADLATGTPVTLDELRAKLAAATVNPDGIRIRVLKSRTAQEGAKADLLTALSAAGVKREEIQERAEFVD